MSYTDKNLEGINQGLKLRTWTDGTEQLICCDCKADNHFKGLETVNLRHSKRCDTPKLQYKEKQNVTEFNNIKVINVINNTHSDNDIFDAYQRGYIGSDDAMNRDF